MLKIGVLFDPEIILEIYFKEESVTQIHRIYMYLCVSICIQLPIEYAVLHIVVKH